MFEVGRVFTDETEGNEELFKLVHADLIKAEDSDRAGSQQSRE